VRQDAPESSSVSVANASEPLVASPGDLAVSRPGDSQWTQQGDAALDKLQADLAASPTSRKRHEGLIRGLLLRGRFAPALAAAERFVELDPDLALARELLGYAAVASGDRRRAATMLDELSENAATSSSTQSRAARAFEALADEARACAHWRSLFELEPSSDAARFEALRCRARVMNDRDAALLDAKALKNPGPRLRGLWSLLDSGKVPAFEQVSGSAGQFEATLSCEPSTDCPSLLVITPTGTVFSPWTPAAERSSATSVSFSGLVSGPYRVLLVGGATSAQGAVKVHALKTLNTFAFTPGHAPTIATTQVSLVPR
jgi:Ca-activated chloride channel family protein